MAGKRRKLAAIAGLIEREYDDREAWLIAEPVQQRLEGMRVVDAVRNIRADVTTIFAEEPRVVIAERARMNLHDQAVVEAHACHLGEHLRAEQFRLARIERAGEYPGE